MTEEKKVEATTTEKKVDDDPKAPEVKEEEKTEEVKESITDEIDYDSKLKQIEDAEHKLAEDKFKFRESKRKAKEEDGVEDLEKKEYLTKDDLEDVLSKQNQNLEEKLEANKIDSLISSATGSEKEKNLVKKILNGTKFLDSFSLEQRISSSVAIANSDKLIGENNELKRALSGKDTASKDASTSTSKGQKSATKVDVAEDIIVVLKQSGMVFSEKNNRYERKLETGKTLYYDEKLKKQVLA